MSVTITIKRNDVGREVSDTLTLDDAPVDLTGATVFFIMKNTEDAVVTRVAAEVVTPTAGAVKVLIADTTVAAVYLVEWEITFQGGGVLTIPGDGYHILEIIEDLG